MWGMSAEQKRFMFTNKCPLCSRYTLPTYELPDGRKVPWYTYLGSMDRGALARCRRCTQTWPVFAAQQVAVQPAAAPAAGPTNVELIETIRSEDPLGDEIRRIDNSGAATSVRRLKFSRRWTQRYEVLVDRTERSGSGFDLSAGGLLRLKAESESAIKRTYGITGESEQTFSEELELTLQPHTAVVLTVHWKRIWQEGVAVIHSPTGLARVPYRAITGVTFDQTSVNA